MKQFAKIAVLVIASLLATPAVAQERDKVHQTNDALEALIKNTCDSLASLEDTADCLRDATNFTHDGITINFVETSAHFAAMAGVSAHVSKNLDQAQTHALQAQAADLTKQAEAMTMSLASRMAERVRYYQGRAQKRQVSKK